MSKLNAATATLINGSVLMVGGGFAYIFPSGEAWSAVWPATAGMVLLVCHTGIQLENKIVSHLAVALTLIVIAGLVPLLMDAFAAQDLINTVRLTIMELASLVALLLFVKSFRDARKARVGAQAE